MRNPSTKTIQNKTTLISTFTGTQYYIRTAKKKLSGCQNVKFSVTFIGHDREQLFSFLFGTRQGSGSELVNVSIVPGGKSSFMTRWSEACHVDMEIKSEMTHNRHCLCLAKHYPSTKGNKKVEKIPCTSSKTFAISLDANYVTANTTVMSFTPFVAIHTNKSPQNLWLWGWS